VPPLQVNRIELSVDEITVPVVQTAFCAGAERVACPGPTTVGGGLFFLPPPQLAMNNIIAINKSPFLIVLLP
jgi:hypothetical protein